MLNKNLYSRSKANQILVLLAQEGWNMNIKHHFTKHNYTGHWHNRLEKYIDIKKNLLIILLLCITVWEMNLPCWKFFPREKDLQLPLRLFFYK